jgi:hypothetical protein
MVSINLTLVSNKEEIAKIILTKMELNGIKKSEIIKGTHLSKTAVNSVLCVGKSKNDYMLGSLLTVLEFLKIKIFIGNNEDNSASVLSLF